MISNFFLIWFPYHELMYISCKRDKKKYLSYIILHFKVGAGYNTLDVWVLLSQKLSQVSNCLWHWTWSFKYDVRTYLFLSFLLPFPLSSYLSSFPHFNSLFPCFRPSVYLSVCLSFCFFLFLTLCLSVYLSVYISGFPSASPFYDHRIPSGGLCLVYFFPGCSDFFFFQWIALTRGARISACFCKHFVCVQVPDFRTSWLTSALRRAIFVVRVLFKSHFKSLCMWQHLVGFPQYIHLNYGLICCLFNRCLIFIWVSKHCFIWPLNVYCIN